jgi:Cyclin D1 binding domain
MLIAYKVTGDKNVPRGEITFQVNLDPFPVRVVGSGASNPEPSLQPISLTEKAAKKWGTSQLPRYKGLGQVAESGFNNNQWMDGQLIIIGQDYFSFAWVPIEQQIFFGRPSPELALKMLRECSALSTGGARTSWDAPPSLDDDVMVLKQYVASCLERTKETVEEELQGDPFTCIWHGNTEECYFE